MRFKDPLFFDDHVHDLRTTVSADIVLVHGACYGSAAVGTAILDDLFGERHLKLAAVLFYGAVSEICFLERAEDKIDLL